MLSDEHAQEIERLLLQGPVWARRTAQTAVLAEHLWDGPGTAELTLFDAGAKPELCIGGVLAQIEEHHGEASGNPPVAQIEVWAWRLASHSAKSYARVASSRPRRRRTGSSLLVRERR